jgi:hypothetical protein
MIPDKVIYTDGHDVIVTDSTLQVKSTVYQLKGITKHSLFTIRAERVPGMILFLMGVVVMAIGLLEGISADSFPDIYVNSRSISANTLAIAFGFLLVLTGLIVSLLIREKYAVRIAIATGEKNVVVSRRRVYISKIVEALDEAMSSSRSLYA